MIHHKCADPLVYLKSIMVPGRKKTSFDEEFQTLYDFVSPNPRFSNECSFCQDLNDFEKLLETHSRDITKDPLKFKILAAERFCRDQKMSLLWYKLGTIPEHYVSGVNMSMPLDILPQLEKLRFT